MSQLDHILQGMNVYVDGVGKLGFCEKLMTPKFKKKTEKFRSGGMLGERQHVMGYEAFEFECEFNAHDPHIIKQSGLFSKKSMPISFTSAFDGDQDAQHTGQFICRGQFIDTDPGGWEAGKKAMLKIKGALDALRLVYDGEEIYDIDVEADKYVIGGTDEYAWIRAAL